MLGKSQSSLTVEEYHHYFTNKGDMKDVRNFQAASLLSVTYNRSNKIITIRIASMKSNQPREKSWTS